MAGLSFLRVVSNDDLDRREEEEARNREMAERQNQPVILGLAAYIRQCWDAAKIAKEPIEDEMLRSIRQRAGEYESDKLRQIRQQGGSEIYMMITDVKCRAAESWLRDILLDSGSPPWDLQPTPVPDLPETVAAELEDVVLDRALKYMQQAGETPTPEILSEIREVVSQEKRFALLREAQNRAERMKDKIKDQFAQGHWGNAFDQFLTDLATFPAAFLKGPIVRRQRKLEWVADELGVRVEPSETLAPEFERVDPFYIFPEPGICDLDDGYLFQYHPLSRSDLSDLIGVPGYDEDAIRKVLDDGPGVSWLEREINSEKEETEKKYHTQYRPTQTFDTLEFWGKVSGKHLLEWGLDEEEVPDPAREYDANVWVIGNYVVKAVLNYDPLGQKPYCKTSFIKAPGAFWGRGIPEIIRDNQNMCNAAARALSNNMGIASGPQVEVNVERIAPNEDLTQMFPWKIWQTINDPLGASAPAVRFHQPNDNASTLVAVYEKFAQLADEHSGIPSYISGDLNVQGAGRTASGLSMLMGSAGKGIRQVVMHIDHDVIKPVVWRQFMYNMRYDADESIKGDLEVVPRGAVNLAVKETTNVRRVEFLNATANEIDMEIMGREGRAAVLREVAKSLQMPADDVIPSRERSSMQARSQELQAAAMAQTAGQAAQQPQQGQSLDPSGAPKGGAAGNVVSNKQTGGGG